MSTNLIFLVCFLHWVFDFVFQTDEMALNKSKSFIALYKHSVVYSLWGCLIGVSSDFILYFVSYLIATHFIIDGVSSRITSRLYQTGERHWFFVMIGFDQFLHYATIFYMLDYMHKMNLV